MPRSFDDMPSAAPIARDQSAEVPKEHARRADDDSSPRDWSQLGRRVLAEAWRRTTEDVARRCKRAIPAVPAPRHEAAP